jgi:GAF domain-containing protein
VDDTQADALRCGDLASVLDLTVLARDLQAGDSELHAVRALGALAKELLHADAAGVTSVAGGRCRTVAATERGPADIDAIQFALGEGPSVSVITTGETHRTGEMRTDPRWPRFGPRAVERTGLHSAMSFPAVLSARTVGALAVYAVRSDAFDDADQAIGTILGAHAAVALNAAQANERTKQLAAVLGRNRRIGTAAGILMVERRWSESQAFEAMAFEATWRYARDQTTRIVDVADEIIRRRGLAGL